MFELLTLCGYEPSEIESDLPRIEKVFNRLGLNDEDIERAKQRLNKYYAVELSGVRKILRLCMQEFVDWVLAKEEGKTKIVYGFMVSDYFNVIACALVSKDIGVYAANLCKLFQFMLGCIFGKIVPVMEAAEQLWVKAGKVSHCGNVKTLVGMLALNLVPKPDILVSCGMLCETAPKTLNIFHELQDIPTCCYDTCQDRDLREYLDATRRAAGFLTKSSGRLTRRIEEVVGFEITDAMLQEAYDLRKQLLDAMSKINNLMENSDPLPLIATHQGLITMLPFLTISKDKLPEAIDAVNILCREIQERVDAGVGVVEKGAPRVLAILPSHFTDPDLDYMVTETGMALVATDMSLHLDDDLGMQDLCGKIAVSGLLRIGMHNSLAKRITSITEGCKRLKIDGVLDRFHIGCRTVTADALIIKYAITEELGIPVMLVERDDFDPRTCDKEKYERDLELFKDVLDSSRQP